MDTIIALAEIISKAKLYYNENGNAVIAVPIEEISAVLEEFATTQTQPVVVTNG